MGTIRIYNEEDNKAYNVRVDIKAGYLSPEIAGSSGYDYYLEISTDIKKIDNTSFSKYIIRTLSDVAPGASAPAADFQVLVNGYIDYFMTTAQMALSSSSSSNSSSSSSEGISSSSSSSSEAHSSSSSSSEGNSSSSSSSSEGTSSSSSSVDSSSSSSS